MNEPRTLSLDETAVDKDWPTLLAEQSQLGEMLRRHREAIEAAWRPTVSLNEAWAEVEAALPEGWQMYDLINEGRQRLLHKAQWRAIVINGHSHAKAGLGPTPAAALQALAARLRSKEPTDV